MKKILFIMLLINAQLLIAQEKAVFEAILVRDLTLIRFQEIVWQVSITGAIQEA